MDVVNLRDLKTYKFNAHGGLGEISMKFSFEDQKGSGMWSIFGYAELPVGATSGSHQHVGNDEWFLVLDGLATMIIDGESQKIKKGDCVLTHDGSFHSIVDVKKKLKFVAVEVNINERPKLFIHGKEEMGK